MNIKENIFDGGYGVPFDFRPSVEKLKVNRSEAILELWENLYHQGNVGLASYFAVPALVNAVELMLVSAIEVARHNGSNPDLPEELKFEYNQSLADAVNQKHDSETQMLGLFIIQACLHGQYRLAKALHHFDINETLEEFENDT